MTTMTVDQLNELPIFPFADVFPMLSSEELMELAQDIEVHGLRHPIILFNNQILDGRNRIRALKRVRGLTDIPVDNFEGSEYEAVEMVRSLNILRRHLSVGQRAMAAQEYLPYEEAEAKQRQGTRTDLLDPNLVTEESQSKSGKSRDIVAEKFNLSGPRITEAKKVLFNAPDLAEKVKSGEMALDKAYRETKARQTEADKKRKDIQEDAELYDDYVHGRRTLDAAYLELQNRKREANKAIKASTTHAMNLISGIHERLEEDLREFNLTIPRLEIANLDEAMEYIDSMEGMMQITFETLDKAMVKRQSGEWED